jgi:dipeptidyl aminopeptidase/acylaminoacyl peptidase
MTMPSPPIAVATLTAILLCSACGTPSQSPDRDVAVAPPQYPIEDFMATTRIGGGRFSADGRKLLFHSNETGVFNVYEVPVTGGSPVRLTSSADNAIFSISFFPQDDRLLYSSDRGGNELTHVYVRELDGSTRDLTPGDKARASFLGWAQDDRSFFVSTNERDPRFMDLYEYAVDGYGRTFVFRNDGGFDLGPISRDKRYLALIKSRTTSDSDIHLLDRQTKKVSHITPHTGNVAFAPAAFTPDSRALLLLTDQGHEFAYLARYDLASSKTTEVLRPEWDVMGAGLSRSGRYLTVAINNDARTELRLFDYATMAPVTLPPMAGANINGVQLSRDERMMAFAVNDSRTPNDLFVGEVGGTPRRLTSSLSPTINREHLVEGTVTRFRSKDGVDIPGILYRPHAAGSSQKAPALVMVHGGPGGQARLGYNPVAQYLANHGYVIFDINNRGSSGYGKTFYAMDDRRHGEADLADVVASKQMLIDTGYVDPARVGIIGGSYGGYMVLSALAFQPDVFSVGVNIFGVSNWLRTLTSIPAWWTAQRDAL